GVLRAVMQGFDVVYGDVERFSALGVRGSDNLAELVVTGLTAHDHRRTERQFTMHHGAVFIVVAFVDGETERLAKPADHLVGFVEAEGRVNSGSVVGGNGKHHVLLCWCDGRHDRTTPVARIEGMLPDLSVRATTSTLPD